MMKRDADEAGFIVERSRTPWNSSAFVQQRDSKVPCSSRLTLHLMSRIIRLQSDYLGGDGVWQLHASSLERAMKVPVQQLISERDFFATFYAFVFGLKQA